MSAVGRAAVPFVVAACTWCCGSACDSAREEPAPPAPASAPLTIVPSASTSAAALIAPTAGPAPTADPASPPAAAPSLDWARDLAPLLFRDINTLADVTLRLYRPDGSLDDAAVAEVERVLWSSKDDAVPRVSRRLLQLVVKAAARFGAQEVHVISSHRGKARKGSRHRSGEAIDFVFPGVPAKALAELLRTFAKVGVGLYVHPRSQYVHLDVREQSYHWLDGSPPGRSWKEHGITDPTAAERDAAHTPADDLPVPPPAAPAPPR